MKVKSKNKKTLVKGCLYKKMADRARLARLRSPPLSAGRATGILPSACGLQVKLTPREFEPHQCLEYKKTPVKGCLYKKNGG